jgi:hypothetical protein
LTSDHKPLSEAEQQRMEAADPNVTVSQDGYIYGELAVARALGSHHLKSDPSKAAFTHTPDMHQVRGGPGPACGLLLLLWWAWLRRGMAHSPATRSTSSALPVGPCVRACSFTMPPCICLAAAGAAQP